MVAGALSSGGKGDASTLWEQLNSAHTSLFQDKVMTPAAWQAHRQDTHRLQPVDIARVMLGYWLNLVWVAVASVLVGVYDLTLVHHYHWPMIAQGSVTVFFSATTFALTLLLVFKTNSCYARWWEARTLVGKLVGCSHNLARQGAAFFPAHQLQLTHSLGRWTAAAMWSVKTHVRPTTSLRDELQGVLQPEELTWLVAQPQKALAVGQALSVIVEAADIGAEAKAQMDDTLALYTACVSACGRIHNTAVPVCYTRHTSRFLMVYIFAGLPLLMWPVCHWASPVLSVGIAFLLLGIEHIGCHIEEPFHVIAFEAFCASVQRDVFTLISAGGCMAPGGGKGSPPVICGLTGPTLATQEADTLLAAAATAGTPHSTRLSLDSNTGQAFRGFRIDMRHELAQQQQQQQQQQQGARHHKPVRADSRTHLLDLYRG